MINFDFSFVKGVGWYPGHMLKATRDIRKQLKLVDVVVILTDARTPISSLNEGLIKITSTKPILIVLNKADLAEDEKTLEWAEYLKSKYENCDYVITETLKRRGLRQITDSARKLIKEDRKKKGATRPLLRPIRLMIVGVPNVGKSSLINALNRKKSTRTGPRPGVTRSQQWITLADDMELLDTPGIMPPGNPLVECGLRLGLINAVKQDLIGKSLLVTYLISQLFKHENYNHLKSFGVKFPVTDYDHILETISAKMGYKLPGNMPDIRKTEEYILREYTDGKFGKMTLDIHPDSQAKSDVTILWPDAKINMDAEEDKES
ncbi:ribosome biogenesis GTPase YlqF [Lentisphaera profundi]|uniref:Ribosome biogenesis GTPase A n=1 Tax=Lentisphaera profundi TaxID=1658616 RepID=A0ABY7W218_9BACT|nr:ribosome biogenesis GTPase YlqF [Lentisphaera profundi]WDE99056.1 ribosome biogenesis GTPase YlqF [Lentisphaera profundi]